MRDHFRRVRSRQDRGCEAAHAVHRERIRREQFFDSGDQGYGAGHKSVT